MTDPRKSNGSSGGGGPSWQRIAVWVIVAAIAIGLIVSGISGIIAKGS